jgi:hypothetical protein
MMSGCIILLVNLGGRRVKLDSCGAESIGCGFAAQCLTTQRSVHAKWLRFYVKFANAHGAFGNSVAALRLGNSVALRAR